MLNDYGAYIEPPSAKVKIWRDPYFWYQIYKGSEVCWYQIYKGFSNLLMSDLQGRQKSWWQIFEGTQMPKAKVETEGKQVASPGNISSRDNLRSRVQHSTEYWGGAVADCTKAVAGCQKVWYKWCSRQKKGKCHKITGWSIINASDIRGQVAGGQ